MKFYSDHRLKLRFQTESVKTRPYVNKSLDELYIVEYVEENVIFRLKAKH